MLYFPPYSWDMVLEEVRRLMSTAVRLYLSNFGPHGILKLDFRNVFDSLYRDNMPEAIQLLVST